MLCTPYLKIQALHSLPDTAVIEINEPNGYLLTIFAGKDKKITQPGRVELHDAKVCADGNCRPPDDVNTVWYKVDGPGIALLVMMCIKELHSIT